MQRIHVSPRRARLLLVLALTAGIATGILDPADAFAQHLRT